ncbi:fungal-specific transcription factor domain-containing protein [Dactylonectria macrodidyma]|uniref:Fungal-specific transcription factor domain-containing protein n=1 Tax=Dactylonectria macrodidyma TaxID=307937 RepID=A0A9P9E8N4_9HYPO|nr:fungal-specific transcription factor domain-containing protein [Dactylonectria macrodidyma]
MTDVPLPQSPLSEDGESRAASPRSVVTNPRRRTKSSQACDRCRSKKIKCNGVQPCKSCLDKATSCSYETMTRRTRGSARERANLLQAQLDHAQMLLRSAGVIDPNLATPPSQPHENTQNCIDVLLHAASLPSAQMNLSEYSHSICTNSNDHCQPDDQHLIAQSSHQKEPEPTVPYLFSPQLSLGTTLNHIDSVSNDNVSSDILPTTSPDTIREALSTARCTSNSANDRHPLETIIRDLDQIGPSGSTLFGNDEDDPEVEEPPSRDEHHGPTSYLSICVSPGIGWIASKIGHSNFTNCAKTLMSSIRHRLRLNKRISKERIDDPDPNTAWKYSRAYFEDSAISTFYLINRQSFEARLIWHFENPSTSQDDSVWFAVRNIVFATGCRALMAKSHSWTESQSQSWKYFENALHVETDLIHGEYGFAAIRVLLAMAIFCEAGSGQKLEYMLVGCALRIAQSKGLHLRSNASRMSPEEDTKRSWLFWSLYCFEKHLSLRSGRPSAINDDDISCELPSKAPDGNPHKLEWFLYAVRLGKISSSIIQKFSTVKARQQPLSHVAKLVHQHDQELRRWYQDVPDLYRQNPAQKTIGLPSGILDEHLHYLGLSYHGCLSVVHCILAHPWNIPGQVKDHDKDVQEALQNSVQALAKSSRDIILTTRSIKVSSMVPAWLLFYYPLIGMINMFICILNSPTSESTPRDISLLEMVAGYFGYLDYSSDATISFSFTASLGTWARQAVSNANAQQENLLASNPLPTTPHEVDFGEMNFFNEIGDFTFDQMAFEEWPSFLPRLP